MAIPLGGEIFWVCPSLDDSANDLSGNSHHGSYNGGMGTVADTDAGGSRAYSFDGIDDHISAATLALTGHFTISAWIKPEAGSYGLIAGTKTTQWYQDNGWMTLLTDLFIPPGFWDIYGYAYSYERRQDITFPTAWFHVLVTGTRGVSTTVTAKYINGGLAIGGGTIDNITASGEPLWIGKRDAPNAGYMKGRMDDFRVFNVAVDSTVRDKLSSKRAYQPYNRRRRILTSG